MEQNNKKDFESMYYLLEEDYKNLKKSYDTLLNKYQDSEIIRKALLLLVKVMESKQNTK